MVARDEIEVAGVRLTSPDKVLSEQGITKRDLANYMVAVADWMLPAVLLAKRPITLVRCPTGRQKKCFYQRHAGSGVPSELGEIPVPGFEEPYLFVRDVGLVALVSAMGVLEIHPWGARNDNPERPDRLVFNLDPGEGLAFSDVVASAREVRAMLNSVKLTSFLKTTGGKGLHLVVPIVRRYDWQEVKAFAKRAAEKLAQDKPERYLIRMSKAERRSVSSIIYATIRHRRRLRHTQHARAKARRWQRRSPGRSSTIGSIRRPSMRRPCRGGCRRAPTPGRRSARSSKRCRAGSDGRSQPHICARLRRARTSRRPVGRGRFRSLAFGYILSRRLIRPRGRMRCGRADDHARTRHPGHEKITSIDVSAASLEQARAKIEQASLTHVEFRQADIFALPLLPGPSITSLCASFSSISQNPRKRWRLKYGRAEQSRSPKAITDRLSLS